MLPQLDNLLLEYKQLVGRAQHADLSDLPQAEVVRFVSRARAAVHRIAGRPSTYVDLCEEIVGEKAFTGAKARKLAGVLDSLRADIEAGYLLAHRELIHGELFADFLEMADHLLAEGYKDAAAVVAGSSLEAHLRQLCVKAGIPTQAMSKADLVNKKADRLNADLAGQDVYSKLDQKNVTAWLDLRNKAAHGQYDVYQAPQVALLIAGVRDFITRHPA